MNSTELRKACDEGNRRCGNNPTCISQGSENYEGKSYTSDDSPNKGTILRTQRHISFVRANSICSSYQQKPQQIIIPIHGVVDIIRMVNIKDAWHTVRDSFN